MFCELFFVFPVNLSSDASLMVKHVQSTTRPLHSLCVIACRKRREGWVGRCASSMRNLLMASPCSDAQDPGSDKGHEKVTLGRHSVDDDGSCLRRPQLVSGRRDIIAFGFHSLKIPRCGICRPKPSLRLRNPTTLASSCDGLKLNPRNGFGFWDSCFGQL